MGSSQVSAEPFEYDVFLSFASADQDLVRPLWQELTLSGLRVFWSDTSLRDRVGSSWFEVIQQSLERSRHFLVICTGVSLSSTWVKREYSAFFNHCYRPPSRLLVPLLAHACTVADLPLFLRDLEVCRYQDEDVSKRLIRVFGGVDVEGLRRELAQRSEEVIVLRHEREALRSRVVEMERRTQEETAERLKQHALMQNERNSLKVRANELEHKLRTIEYANRAPAAANVATSATLGGNEIQPKSPRIAEPPTADASEFETPPLESNVPGETPNMLISNLFALFQGKEATSQRTTPMPKWRRSSIAKWLLLAALALGAAGSWFFWYHPQGLVATPSSRSSH
jgi:regulator of replication initiation timing